MAEPFIGQILCVGFPFTPTGYAACNGQLLNISEFDALFALIGTTYGGDGQNTFGLPDLRGRTPVHQGSAGGTTVAVGQSGGTESVTLTSNQLPIHTHGITAQTGNGNQTSPAGNYFAGASDGRYANSGNTTTGTVLANSSSSAGPHENRQPFLCMNYIIAVNGVFPIRN